MGASEDLSPAVSTPLLFLHTDCMFSGTFKSWVLAVVTSKSNRNDDPRLTKMIVQFVI